MAVMPEDMMAQLRQRQGAPGSDASAGEQPGGMPADDGQLAKPGPTSAMPQPQEKEGLKEAARVNIHIAMNMLEQALPVFGAESKEGKEVLKVLTSLGKLFGDSTTSDLHPAEIRQLVGSMPQAGGGSDVQKMLMQQAQGGQGGPPPGQPPQPPMMH